MLLSLTAGLFREPRGARALSLHLQVSYCVPNSLFHNVVENETSENRSNIMLKTDRTNVYGEIKPSKAIAIFKEIKVHTAILFQGRDAMRRNC